MMLSLVLSPSISGQQKVDATESKYQMTYTTTFSLNDFSFSTQKGYDTIHLNDGGYTTEVGKPMVPVKNIRIALPEDMKATSIRILDMKEQTVDGTFILYPAQPAYPIGKPGSEIQFIQPDAQTYQSSQTYPTKRVELTGQSDLAGQSIADMTVYPMNYVPLQKKVTLVSSITFTIEGICGYLCGDYLPTHLSDSGREMYQKMVQNMVINPENVELRFSPTPQPAGVDPGDYNYVIITQDSWVSAFQPLADWKTQKGVPANIVTTAWIYNEGGYSGSNVDKIRAFVQDAYTTWGTTYVLLCGDIDVVPCHYKSFPGVDSDPVPNDAYYADFDSDWVCEVNVGRASVTGLGDGTGQIGNFISKILTYEKNPPLIDYATKAGFFGFNLDSSTHAEQCKININDSYIPTNWTMTTVYDSQGGNHPSNVIAAINEGQNLLNHADHSNWDYMGTGYVNHGWGLGNSDMDALSNGNKQGILYSMGCDPAAYDQSNCIGEHFVRNSNGGGIAFIGNSRYGWYNPGNVNTLSMAYDVHFFKSLFQQNLYNLGAAFSDHKNNGYQNDEYYKYCYTELTLLGDPELPIWKENPISLVVTHPNQIPLGASAFTVIVTSNGNPVDKAYVCLWKGSEVYLTGTTNSAGAITLNISPTSLGTISVTVTKQNYLPYEGSVTVGGEGEPYLTIGTINGRLLAVTTDIKNIGEASATNIKWKITVDGDLMVSGLSMSGTMTSLGVSNTASIENAPVLGFGNVIITVKVSADGVPEVIKTVNGFVFFIFIIV